MAEWHLLQQRDHFKHFQRQAQAALRRMQDEWWEKADEMETFAATKNSKIFFSTIEEVYGPTKPHTTPLLSADGSTLLKEKSTIKTSWREHFSTLLNRPSTVGPIVLDQIPQKPVITSLDLPPTIDEILKAIRQTSSGKSPGMDGIPAEIFKSAGPVALKALHSLLTSIWEERMCPKNSGMPHSSPCSRTGAVRPTVATTGAFSPVRCWEDPGSGHTQSPHHQHLGGKPPGSPVWIPSKPQHHRHDLVEVQ